MNNDWIIPNWPAPCNIRAVTTTRNNGVSCGSYNSFNLATHVGDDLVAVIRNRQILFNRLSLPSEPNWLEQVHSINVLNANLKPQVTCRADASYSHSTGVVCAVLTADCLPVLFCDYAGTCVAAVHAGWRGLLSGILEQTLDCLNITPNNLMAWLGPAIGPNAFEVGDEVHQAFIDVDTTTSTAFLRSSSGRWLADIYQLARLRLNQRGINNIYGGDFCTFNDHQRFYSYRRDKICGRFASLIWLI